MASGRRGGPPDLKSTLGSLLRTTLEQVGAVKDVVEQQTRGRGGLIDQALEQRRRKDAMAKLGEALYEVSRRGELGEIALEPDIAMALADVESFAEPDWQDDGLVPARRSPRDAGPEAVSSASYKAPKRTEPKEEYRVWRPVLPEDDVEPEVHDHNEAGAAEPIPSSTKRVRRKSAHRTSAGIRFEEQTPQAGDLDCDDDLGKYMHDDDVPE